MTVPTTRLRLANVVAAVNGTPWAILPAKLDEICGVIAAHSAGASLPPQADPFAARREASRGRSAGAVAIVPIYGSLVPRAGMMTDYSGASSADSIAQAVTQAANDPNVGTIVLDVDSPGGSVLGIAEAAAAIAAARERKPVLAVVNTMAASAAYYLASQATEIIGSPSSMSGNIGVIIAHLDTTGAQAQDGIKYQVVTAGKYKHEGHAGQPLDEDALAATQAMVDDYYAAFVNAVASGRGVSPATVRNGFGEGRILTATQALAEGVIDRIGTLDSVLAELGTARVTRGARADAPRPSLAASAALDPSAGAAPAASAPRVSAGSEATPTLQSLRLVTATSARSNTVTPEELAAQAAAAAESVAAERRRVAEISALGREHNVDAARVEQWINSGVSADAAGRQILADMKSATATQKPVANVSVQAPREGNVPFADAADFFGAVVGAARRPEATDVRLLNIRGSQNNSVGADGGWAVPESIANVLLEASTTGGELLSRVTERPITVGNTYKETVVKEESRINGSRNGGVQGFWVGEETDIPESQAKTRQLEIGLKKVAAIVKLTEEQLEDAPAMVSFLNEQVPEELRFQKERAIWEGTGSGQPLGFMNGGALVTVAIEGSQTIANTAASLWVNAAKMFGRMPARMLPGAAWFINQELYAKILTATAGASGQTPMFTPPGMLEMAPNGAIYGKPIVPVEYASAEGTVGDFVFANLADYLFASKGGVRQSVSMHVEFIKDRQVMKFIERVDGQPRTRAPLQPLKGSATLSPYIALATRS